MSTCWIFLRTQKGLIMKRSILSLAVMSTLAGCSVLDKVIAPGTTINPGPQQAISEQRLSSDFKREGVRVTYTLSGALESLEATGFAPVWGNSENARREAYRVAELEAKKAINDFINQETVTSSKSLEIISRNLEKARDNKLNNFASNRSPNMISSSDDDLDSDNKGEGKADTKIENAAIREDALRIASNTRTEIRIQNKGILGGLQLRENEVINEGRTVRVVYRWDKKNNEQRAIIRNMMAQ